MTLVFVSLRGSFLKRCCACGRLGKNLRQRKGLRCLSKEASTNHANYNSNGNRFRRKVDGVGVDGRVGVSGSLSRPRRVSG
ncbi:unnamed protein product [Ectocarpus sp. 12 AP-2014]